MINQLSKSILVQDTSGILNLEVARLERYLKVLEQRLILCAPYPNHKTKLAEKKLQVQYQLQQLLQHRDSLK